MKTPRKARVAMVALIVLLSLAPNSGLRAESRTPDAETLRREREETEAEMSRSRTELSRVEAEISKLKASGKAIDKKIRLAELEVRKAIQLVNLQQGRVKRAREEIREVGAKIEDANDSLKSGRKALARRANALLKSSLMGELEYLATSSDAAELELRARLLELVSRADAELIENTVEARDRMETLKKKREDRLKDLVKEEAKLRAEKENEARTRNELKKLQAANQKQLGKAEARKKEVLAAMSKLKKSLQAIEKKLEGLSKTYKAPTKFRSDGRFFTPPEQIDLDGVYILAASGSPVRLAANEPGEVLSIQSLKGLGHTVLVGHGGKVTTVYGNLSSVSVSVGDKVSPRQELGKSGVSAWGEMYYFAIYRNGVALDPRSHL